MSTSVTPTPAPASPAPASAPIRTVQTPQPIAPVSAVEAASQAARERIAQTGSALPDPTAPNEPGDRPAHHAQTQNRAPNGRFSTDRFAEVGRGVPVPDDEPPASANAQSARSEDEPAAGPDAPRPDPAAADGQTAPGPDRAPENEGEPTGEEVAPDDPRLTVPVPGRNPTDPDYEIVVDSLETAERLRQLVNAAMRGDEARAYVAEQMREIEAARDAITVDPAGFLLDTFRDAPEVVEHVALALLSQPGVWQRVAPRVLNWDDPDKFELDAAKIARQQYEMRDQLRTMAEQRRVVADNLRDVQQAVQRMIPATLDPDQQAAFYRDALRDLKDYADRHRLLTLDVNDIPLLLARRLAAYGLDPLEAARGLSTPARREAPASRTPSPALSSAAATREPPRPKSGKQFVAAAEKRRRAAAIAPPGAGSPSNVPTPPEGQSIEQRIAWHRQQLQLGKKKL